ncbi:MAG: RNA polymerase sigma factor [Longimicrobiales bacterium]|nr:RNA polymerase sigma factor [Longimicrobiales bacterium]
MPLVSEVEVELIHKCRAGDARFFEPLVRAYEAPGLRLATLMMGDPDEARDALQEAFVKVFRNLSRFDTRRAFGPWFYQILRNQCRDMIRARNSRGGREIRDERLDRHAADGAAGPLRARERSEAREILQQGLERVGEDHREILILREIQGFQYPEIAEVLGIPEGTVASRLYHARRALRAALDDLGVRYP